MIRHAKTLPRPPRQTRRLTLWFATIFAAASTFASPSFGESQIETATKAPSKIESPLRLIMFETSGCHWCERWNEEIGPVYPKTAEGKAAPLERRDIYDPMPEDVALARRPAFTPTFVLVQDGKEVGRIEGYPGEDFFWPMLGSLIEDVGGPDCIQLASCTRSGT